VALLGFGYTNRAAALGIARGTAAIHVHHVLRNLGLPSRWLVGERRIRSI
jgi:hypothetical protein